VLVVHACKEAAIRRIVVQSPPRQRLKGIPCQKENKQTPSHKKSGEVDQGVGPDFKPQYHQKKWTV
jgi:hypothetical protein